MKKIFSLVAVIFLTAMFAGCSTTNANVQQQSMTQTCKCVKKQCKCDIKKKSNGCKKCNMSQDSCKCQQGATCKCPKNKCMCASSQKCDMKKCKMKKMSCGAVKCGSSMKKGS